MSAAAARPQQQLCDRPPAVMATSDNIYLGARHLWVVAKRLDGHSETAGIGYIMPTDFMQMVCDQSTWPSTSARYSLSTNFA